MSCKERSFSEDELVQQLRRKLQTVLQDSFPSVVTGATLVVTGATLVVTRFLFYKVSSLRNLFDVLERSKTIQRELLFSIHQTEVRNEDD